MKQPLGVKIFGTLFLVFGLLSLWFQVRAIAYLLLDPKLSSQFLQLSKFIRATGMMLIDLLFHLTCGVGLLMLKPWARRLTMLLGGLLASKFVLFVGASVIAFVATRPHPIPPVAFYWLTMPVGSSLGQLGIVVCWYGVIIGYFLRPSVKAQFVSKGR